MRPRSLRVRVGLAAALSILVALAVLGTTLVVLLGRQLHDELDRALRTRATDVAQLVATTPKLVTQPGALEAPLGGQQLFVEVLDRHQRIVARSSALGAKVLSVPDAQREALAGRSARTSVTLGDTPLRVLAAPLPAGSGTAAGGVVLVAASTQLDRRHDRRGSQAARPVGPRRRPRRRARRGRASPAVRCARSRGCPRASARSRARAIRPAVSPSPRRATS